MVKPSVNGDSAVVAASGSGGHIYTGLLTTQLEPQLARDVGGNVVLYQTAESLVF